MVCPRPGYLPRGGCVSSADRWLDPRRRRYREQVKHLPRACSRHPCLPRIAVRIRLRSGSPYRSTSTATTRAPRGSASVERLADERPHVRRTTSPSRCRASARNTSSRARNAGVPFRRLAATARSAWAAAAAASPTPSAAWASAWSSGRITWHRCTRVSPGYGPHWSRTWAAVVAVTDDLGRFGQLGHRPASRRSPRGRGSRRLVAWRGCDRASSSRPHRACVAAKVRRGTRDLAGRADERFERADQLGVAGLHSTVGSTRSGAAPTRRQVADAHGQRQRVSVASSSARAVPVEVVRGPRAEPSRRAGRTAGCGRRAAEGSARCARPTSELAPFEVQQRLGVQPGEHQAPATASSSPSRSSSMLRCTCSSSRRGWRPMCRAPSSTGSEHVVVAERAGDRLGFRRRARCPRPTRVRRSGRPSRSAVAPSWRSARFRAPSRAASTTGAARGQVARTRRWHRSATTSSPPARAPLSSPSSRARSASVDEHRHAPRVAASGRVPQPRRAVRSSARARQAGRASVPRRSPARSGRRPRRRRRHARLRRPPRRPARRRSSRRRRGPTGRRGGPAPTAVRRRRRSPTRPPRWRAGPGDGAAAVRRSGASGTGRGRRRTGRAVPAAGRPTRRPRRPPATRARRAAARRSRRPAGWRRTRRRTSPPDRAGLAPRSSSRASRRASNAARDPEWPSAVTWVTSSGLPPVSATIASASSAATPTSAATSSRSSPRSSRRVTAGERSRSASNVARSWSRSGAVSRVVATTSRRARPAVRTSWRTTSRVVAVDQCRSSITSRIGADAAAMRQPVPDAVDHRRGRGQVVRTRCGPTGGAGEHTRHLDRHGRRRRRRPHRRWPGRTARTVAPRPRSRHRTAPAHRRRAPRPPARRRGGSCPSRPRRPRPRAGCARPTATRHRSRSSSRSATRPTNPAGSASSSSAGGSSGGDTGVSGAGRARARRTRSRRSDASSLRSSDDTCDSTVRSEMNNARRDLGVRPALHDQVEDLGLPPRDTPVRCGSSPPDRVEIRRRQEERRLRTEAAQLHRPDVDQCPIPPAARPTRWRPRPRSPPPRHRERRHADGQPDSPPDRSSRRRARPPRPCARPHECGSPPSAGHSSARTATCSRCAARNASVARVNTENVESPSPRAFNTVPPSPSTAAVTSSSWRARRDRHHIGCSLPQLRRADHVREHERDHPCRQPPHQNSMAPGRSPHRFGLLKSAVTR